MTEREVICSQQLHCLSCPISVGVTGKDCRELSVQELRRYVGKEMYIDDKWMDEPEIIAYVGQLHMEIAELKDEIKILRETLSRHTEEEYE